MGRLDQRVGIITGAAQGIGREYALGVAAEGARVVVADLDDTAASVAAIEASGGEALGVSVDITSEASVDAMVAATLDRFGKIDFLVNNAALYGKLQTKFFRDISVEEWDRVMTVNLRGMFVVTKAVSGPMMAAGRGSIVNISSGTALHGTPGLLHYVTSKGGVIAMTRALARELGSAGVTVNAVTPGFTMSEGSKELLRRGGAPDDMDPTLLARAIQRPQTPHDLVGAVLFLVSDDAAFMTGQVVNVDGGWIAH